MSDLVIENIVEHPDGLEIDFVLQGQNYHLVSPIIGEHHAGILVGAFLVAREA